MNNGYQKYNGCGADKDGRKIFNTFFYHELQSKHVRPLATNGKSIAVRWGLNVLLPHDSTKVN